MVDPLMKQCNIRISTFSWVVDITSWNISFDQCKTRDRFSEGSLIYQVETNKLWQL
jgi:hypothetical protein